MLSFVTFIRDQASNELISQLHQFAAQKAMVASGSKRKSLAVACGVEENGEPRRKRFKVDDVRFVKPRHEYDCQAFLHLPSQADVHLCYEHFYAGSSNAAVQFLVCSVCGRKLNMVLDQVQTLLLKKIPNFTSSPASRTTSCP